MESRELSQSNENLEKDVTLNPGTAPEKAAETTEKKVTEVAPTEAAADVTPQQTAPADGNSQPVAAQTEQAPVAAAETPNYAAMSKDELVAALKDLSTKPIEEVKDDVALIKSAFFALRKEEVAKAREAFVAEGNGEDAFAPAEDPDEVQVKALLGEFKERKAQFNAEQEAVKADNLAKKQAIIDEINAIIADPDNVNRQFSHVQQLQQNFKAIGEVPAANSTEVWKDYQQTVEKFYDLLKMNKELRDYDFKKNLEIKQQLCLEAEALDDEPDVVTAFKKLQELHNTWRETGPVAKELREDLWARFKNASAVINKKYQAHFEERKAHEKENAEAKTALCEQIEQISTDGLKTYASWDEATKKIIDLQQQWKKLGFASRKVNTELFARFRKKCDEFFAQKAEFFKTMKEELAANLAKKNELCERAEAMMNSTDWKKTTDAFVALQKEWKTIGPVAKKHSDAVWKRFIAACDHFFDEKKKLTSSVRTQEHDNLKKKKEIIAQINAVLEQNDAEAGPDQVRDLMQQWQGVGHVPYKEKDKVYAQYKEAIDKAFDQFDMKGTRARMARFQTSLSQMGSGDKVSRERERLVRSYEAKVQELKTFENNLGFLNARSKSGNSLVKEMEASIGRIKDQIAELAQKIKLIDEKL